MRSCTLHLLLLVWVALGCEDGRAQRDGGSSDSGASADRQAVDHNDADVWSRDGGGDASALGDSGGTDAGPLVCPGIGYERVGETCQPLEGWFGVAGSDFGHYLTRLESSSSGGGLSGNPYEQYRIDLVTLVSGAPVVAFDSPLTVRSWDGSRFVELGEPSITEALNITGGALVRLFADSAGRPVLVYWMSDGLHLGRWDGSSWTELGALELSGTTLPAVAASGDQIYVARGPGGITVSRWDGATWTDLPGDAAKGYRSPIAKIDVAVGAAGLPAVAYEIETTIRSTVRLTVFDGAGWAGLGPSATSDGVAANGGQWQGSPSVAIADDGAPWVAFEEEGSGSVHVYAWDGGAWVSRGPVSGQKPVLMNGAGNTLWLFVGSTGQSQAQLLRWASGTFAHVADPLPASAQTARVAFAGELPVLGFTSTFSGNSEAYVQRYDGDRWTGYDTHIDEQGLSPDARSVNRVRASMTPDGRPQIVYDGGDLSGWLMAAALYQDGAFQIGPVPVSVSYPPEAELATDSAGRTLVLWHGDGALVARWNGVVWEDLGSRPDSNNDAVLAVDALDRPVIARSSYSSPSSRLHVEVKDGEAWVPVGDTDPILTAPYRNQTIMLTAGTSGEVAVTWDGTVQLYDGTSWIDVSSGLPEGHPYDLTLGPQGSLLVLLAAPGGYGVAAFDGSAWALLGDGPIPGTAGSADPDLCVAPDGEVLVAWADGADGHNDDIHLRAWDGATWREIAGSDTGGAISNSAGQSSKPAVMAADGIACVAWLEPGDATREVWLRCAHR